MSGSPAESPAAALAPAALLELRLCLAKGVWGSLITHTGAAAAGKVALTGRTPGAVNRWFDAHGALPLDGQLKTSVLESLRKSSGLPQERASLLGSLLQSDECTTPDQIFDFLTSHAAIAALLCRRKHSYQSPSGRGGCSSPVTSPSTGGSGSDFAHAAASDACVVGQDKPRDRVEIELCRPVASTL